MSNPTSSPIEAAHSLVKRLVVFLALLVAGCQTLAVDDEDRRDTEQRRDRVQIVEDEAAVTDCKATGEVAVRPPFPMLTKAFPELTSFGSEEVNKQLRYQALLAGGDTVLRTGVEEGLTRGRAFDCRREHA